MARSPMSWTSCSKFMDLQDADWRSTITAAARLAQIKMQVKSGELGILPSIKGEPGTFSPVDRMPRHDAEGSDVRCVR